MVSRVFSAGLSGIDGYIVTVECFLSGGLPRLDVVGLPTGAVSEAGERVRAAAKACAFDWPVSRLTVNLAPADTKKAGTAYDLPILLSILAAAGEIDAPPDNALFFGELSLTGELRPVCGALSMALAARDAGFKTVFVPAMNAAEASYASGVTVFPIHTLNELLGHLNGRKPLTPCAPPPRPEPQDDALDFAHVLGQHAVKRALEIAAAGGHNVLLSGPPGSGKSMAAKRFSTILPPLSDSERLEVIRVWSAIGRGQEAVERAERPFRAPHHNSSANAMAGGSGAAGRLPVPGEITLAHRGVLFLDEFPEFRRDVLDSNYLAERIRDHRWSPFPTLGTTERPDVAASRMLEGRCVIVVDGSPVALTAPFLFQECFQSNDDYYISFLQANLSRILRVIGFVFTITFPAMYAALMLYHRELVPARLLFAVSAAQRGVPLPIGWEILLMLFVLEALKEAGARTPGAMGQTMSIVGGLVLGDAAVSARFAAAPTVIVVAIAGVTGLMVPKLQTAALWLRFVLLAAAASWGLYGVGLALGLTLAALCRMHSCSVPYLLNLVPRISAEHEDTWLRYPWFFMRCDRFAVKHPSKEERP